MQVLPEITLGPPFFDERLASLNHLRIRPKNEEDFKKQEKVENLDAAVTPWPAWVYRQYDPFRLSLKIRRRLQFIKNRKYIFYMLRKRRTVYYFLLKLFRSF